MPGLFIAFIVVAIIAVLVGLGSFAATTNDGKVGARVVAGVFGFVALLLIIFASVTSIGTQDVGVLTSFGHPSGALSNGLHWKAPWEKVTTLDNAIQTDTYASNGDGSTQQGAQGGCINVRIARQATACVNTVVRWQERIDGVDYLFRNYRNNDNIRNNLLHRDLQTAVNKVFANYDPLGLDPKTGDSTQPTAATLADQVQTQLQSQVGQWINVSTVFIPIFNFDQDTQKRLNLLQQQVAQTRVAQQAEQTAIAQAAANKALAKSVSNDPGVLISKCLDILSEAVQKEQALPAGFSCFGGTNTAVAVK